MIDLESIQPFIFITNTILLYLERVFHTCNSQKHIIPLVGAVPTQEDKVIYSHGGLTAIGDIATYDNQSELYNLGTSSSAHTWYSAVKGMV